MLYIDRPKNFKPKFEIVSCFIEVDGEILLLHRQDDKPQGDTWGVPAGKKDVVESIEEAIKREINEEINYGGAFSGLKYFDKVFVQYPTFDFIYHIFHLPLKNKPKIKLNPAEHKDYIWKTPEFSLKMKLIEDEEECIKLFYKETQMR
jgi:8-oxo-dGTP pyrophosphatase MutT (NUDIX family)